MYTSCPTANRAALFRHNDYSVVDCAASDSALSEHRTFFPLPTPETPCSSQSVRGKREKPIPSESYAIDNRRAKLLTYTVHVQCVFIATNRPGRGDSVKRGVGRLYK